MLTEEQRRELDEHGPITVRFMLLQYGSGRGAAVGGFKCGDITKGDIDDWLATKSKLEDAQAKDTLRWAKIAGWAGIVGVVVSVVAAVIGFWLQR